MGNDEARSAFAAIARTERLLPVMEHFLATLAPLLS